MAHRSPGSHPLKRRVLAVSQDALAPVSCGFLIQSGALVNRCGKTSGGFLLRDLVDRYSIDIFGTLVDVFHQLRCLQPVVPKSVSSARDDVYFAPPRSVE